jgi:hypothetical protein
VRKILGLVIVMLLVTLLAGCDLLAMIYNRPTLIVDLDAVAKASGRQELMQKELEFANLRLTEQLKLVESQT